MFSVPHGTVACTVVVGDDVWVGTDRGALVAYNVRAARAASLSPLQVRGYGGTLPAPTLAGRELPTQSQKTTFFKCVATVLFVFFVRSLFLCVFMLLFSTSHTLSMTICWLSTG